MVLRPLGLPDAKPSALNAFLSQVSLPALVLLYVKLQAGKR